MQVNNGEYSTRWTTPLRFSASPESPVYLDSSSPRIPSKRRMKSSNHLNKSSYSKNSPPTHRDSLPHEINSNFIQYSNATYPSPLIEENSFHFSSNFGDLVFLTPDSLHNSTPVHNEMTRSNSPILSPIASSSYLSRKSNSNCNILNINQDEQSSQPRRRLRKGLSKSSRQDLFNVSITENDFSQTSLMENRLDDQETYPLFEDDQLFADLDRYFVSEPALFGDQYENLTPQEKFSCPICYTEGTSHLGYLSECSHYFCFDCVFRWSKLTNLCPLCKERFRTIQHYKLIVETNTIEKDESYPNCVQVECKDLKTQIMEDMENEDEDDNEVYSQQSEGDCVICHGQLPYDLEDTVPCSSCGNFSHIDCVMPDDLRLDCWICDRCIISFRDDTSEFHSTDNLATNTTVTRENENIPEGSYNRILTRSERRRLGQLTSVQEPFVCLGSDNESEIRVRCTRTRSTRQRRRAPQTTRQRTRRSNTSTQTRRRRRSTRRNS